MMNLNKYKLADIAKIEISGVDKKTIEGETPVRLCNFVDVYYNWAVTKEKAKSFMAASAKQTEIDKCSIGKGMVAITNKGRYRCCHLYRRRLRECRSWLSLCLDYSQFCYC